MFHVKQDIFKTRNYCPVCGNDSLKQHSVIKDYFLTRKEFSISQCKECNFLFTNPYPDESVISDYYKSDSYFSHPKSGFSIFSFVYNLIRRYNIKNKYRVVTDGIKVGNVLDIGCGSGDFLNFCKEKNWNISGVEPNTEAREFASKRMGKEIFQPNQQKYFESHSFDLITLWHVLEHIDDLDMQFDEIRRLLKKSGRLVIALPNYKSYDAVLYGNTWAAWDVPRHLHHFDKSTISLLAKRHGFILQRSLPMVWDAFYVSLLSEKYRNSRLYPLRAFINGCKSNNKAKKSQEYSSLIYIFTPENID